ncbi:exopolysaccharide biosynthesis polyprenyl glycosylphosphotransferase [Sphingopyxis panaciterrae]
MKAISHPVRPANSLRPMLETLRVQLVLSLLAGLILPVMVLAIVEPSILPGNDSASTSALAAALAIIAAIVAIRKFGEFPSTIGAQYIFPAFATSFGVAIAVILLVRAPYSGRLLISAFLCSLAARFMIDAFTRRGGRSMHYIVPGGKVDRILPDLEGAAIVLDQPFIPGEAHAIVVADLHHDHTPEWESTFAKAALNGIGVYHYKQIWEARTGKVRIEHLSENSLGSLIPSNSYATAKRFLDVVGSLIALPVLFLPLLVTALLIRLDSPGSVFFRQERIGFRGERFRVLKFRTMREAKAQSAKLDLVHDAITQDDDVRITRIGRFLRKTRIDELPQIVNILLGEMSWIGPRPEARPLSEWYEREIPFYSYRHIVRPGITGWAQVNQGHVATIREVHDKLRYDFYYIKNFSMWIDLVILIKTVLVVIRGSGAK